MNRKVKLLIGIIIITLIASISTSCIAITVSRSVHVDAWTGEDELMSQGGGDTAEDAIICILKGGTIRFTPAGRAEAMSFEEVRTLHHHTVCESSEDDTSLAGDSKIKGIVGNIKNKIKTSIKNFEGCEANAGTGVWAKYWSSNFKFTEVETIKDSELAWNGLPVGTSIVAKSKPYTIEQKYQKDGNTVGNTNNWAAYLLSAGKEFDPLGENFKLKEGNYTPTVSDQANVQLVQDAVWCSELNGGTKKSTPQIAVDLVNESKAYAKIAKELTADNAKIIDSQAQVIVNRTKGTYIIGPYRLQYPDDTRFYYVQDLYITNTAGNKIATPTVISKTGDYPKSGEIFFLEIKAKDIKGVKKVKVEAEFAYLSLTDADYDKYKGKGQIRQLVGYINRKQDTHTVYGPWRTETVTDYESIIGQNPDGTPVYGEKDIQVRDEYNCTIDTYTGTIGEKNIGSYVAQDLIEVLEVEREWSETEKLSKALDLTIKLGGYVWVDEEGGKESVANGVIDANEEESSMVSKIQVTLSDGQTATTNDKGYYEFTGLDAMQIYSVTFRYNGQYYQPTTCMSHETWGMVEYEKDEKGNYLTYIDEEGKEHKIPTLNNWKTNSNAKDNEDEREHLNDRFASIEAAPKSYKVKEENDRKNTTYTREELLAAGIIDEFGNLIGNSNASMVQYVKDCMINAYTETEYPVPDIFVIDEFQYPSLLTPKAEVLYDTAFFINLGLNSREKSDLAIKKDIEKVELEINGQKHTYTYDNLENKENAENTWDISVRLSDAYYKEAYTRELYKSDYLYKVDYYGTNYADYGRSEDDELDVYITYKIMVRNQAMSIRTRIDEVVDYYDSDLTYVPERSYILHSTRVDGKRVQDKYTVQPEKEDIEKIKESNFDSTGKIDGYNNLYIRGLGQNAQKILEDGNGNVTKETLDKGMYLNAGDTAYIYLTFVVNKDEARNVLLDEKNWELDENGNIKSATAIGVGKENIVEINGYSTIYAPGTYIPNVVDENGNPKDVGGTPAGLVDTDSTAGNVDEIKGIKKDLDFNTSEGEKIYKQFEDDTDKAPNMKLILYRNDNTTRVISGSIWEDIRNDKDSYEENLVTIGDGEKDNILINGVTVQLVEIMENGKEFVWKTFDGSGTKLSTEPIINAYINGDTNKPLVVDYKFEELYKGDYAFKSFAPGKYVVRFIYGDTEKTILTKDVNSSVNKTLGTIGLNDKSYNGQDYKSTTYQEGIVQDKTYTWNEKSTWENGKEILGKTLTEVSTFKEDASNNERISLPERDANGNFETITVDKQKGYLYDIAASDTKDNVSDAKDIESRRNTVNDYSNDNVRNHIAEVLSSHEQLQKYLGKDYTKEKVQLLIDELKETTQMTAETGLMVIEFEYNNNSTDGDEKDNSYHLQYVDLGLEERPKAGLAVDKEVTNVKLVLADGSILFDAKKAATNLLWKDHKQYLLDYTNEGFMADNNKIKLTNIEDIRRANSSKIGLIQMSMDEELMHGANIEITYKITVSNVGEIDYYNTYEGIDGIDRKFYYTGHKTVDPSNKAKVVTTKANQVIDYVANNLQFNVKNNSDWEVIKKENLISETNKYESLVNSLLEKQVEKYNTIIVTKNLNEELVPELYRDKVDTTRKATDEVPLVLTQLITSENDTDDLTYDNIVEIVDINNSLGRRMAFSVVGNQDPTKEPQEMDSDQAEVVKILPPFGNSGTSIIITAISTVVLLITIGGIVFIKKKVLIK